MPGLKIFTGEAGLPVEWGRAIGDHVGVIVAVAPNKAAIVGLLANRGVGRLTATRIVRDALRLAPAPAGLVGSVPLWEVLAADIVPLDTPGIYLYRYAAAAGEPIIRVDQPGTVSVVGHFDKDPSRGVVDIIAKPVTSESESKC